MHEVLLIARREYLERVRSRAFLVMTILFPLFIGLMIGGSFLAGKLSSGDKNIAIASNDPVLASEVAAEMEPAPRSTKPPEVIAPATDAERAALNQRVEDKTLDGYLWLEKKPGSNAPEATFVSRSTGDLFSLGGMESAGAHGVEREQLVRQGASSGEIDPMKRDGDIQTMPLRKGQLIPSNSRKSFFSEDSSRS